MDASHQDRLGFMMMLWQGWWMLASAVHVAGGSSILTIGLWGPLEMRGQGREKSDPSDCCNRWMWVAGRITKGTCGSWVITGVPSDLMTDDESVRCHRGGDKRKGTFGTFF